MKLVRYTAERFDEVVELVARLNSDHAHHIGFFGTDPADIAFSLRAASPPPEIGYQLLEQDGRLAGLLGLEADAQLGRAWLYGPLLDAPDWQAWADRLYAAVLPAIPAAVFEHELFCDARNANVRAFADRHAFPLHSEAAILNFFRAQLASLPLADAPELSEAHYAEFADLHQRLFPRTYASADQLIARRGADARNFMLVEGGALVGYACVKIEPAAGQGYVDYLGTAEADRRRGVGTRLMRAALRWMFGHPEVQRVDLTVNADNQAALRLYAGLGLTEERTMCVYRKRVVS